jgi:hypothetical protein
MWGWCNEPKLLQEKTKVWCVQTTLLRRRNKIERNSVPPPDVLLQQMLLADRCTLIILTEFFSLTGDIAPFGKAYNNI